MKISRDLVQNFLYGSLRLLTSWRTSRLLVVLLLSLFPISSAWAQAWWEDDFSRFDQNRYFVRGDRTYWDQNGQYFVLTPPENSLAGRIYHRQRVFTGVFEAEFDIRIGGGTGADGMTLAWVTDYNYNPASGGGHDFDAQNGYAVEFDCYNNAGIDPNGQHIAILRNNWQTHLAAWQANEGVIEDNRWHHIRVSNQLGYIQIWFDNQRVLEHRIQNYQAFEGYFGFTAGTGGATNWHIVDNVRISIGGPELDLSRSRVEFGPLGVEREVRKAMILFNRADGEEEWRRLQFTITDSGEGPDWLTLQPAQGVIAPGDSVEVAIIARTSGIRVGEYHRRIYIRTNDPYRQLVQIPAHIIVVEGMGRLRGRVIDAATREPIEGAEVRDPRFEMEEITDEEGAFDFGEVGAYRYQLRITRRDYLPLQREVEVGVDDDVSVEWGLFYSVFSPQPERVWVAVPVDEVFRTIVTIRNPGNGPLTWTSRLRFPEGGEAEPYSLRFRFPAADSVGDNRLVGIEYADQLFYVAGGNNGQGRGNIYVFDREGRYVRRFPQFMNSAWGMRDLAWDGELLWGGDGNTIFGFTPQGDSVCSFRSPINPSRAIAWDAEREVLWVCDVLSDIVALDREGQERARIRRPGIRIYGLAWFPLDEEGFSLYAYVSDDQTPNGLYKINPESGQFRFLVDLPVEGEGRAGGLAITTQWDPYAWVLVGLVQGLPDAVYVWQLAPRTEWVRLDPIRGVVEPGEAQEQSVIFNTRDLPVDQQFEAWAVYEHDGVGGVTEIPILLSVTGAGGLSQRWLSLQMGWNLVSVNVQPPEEVGFAQNLEPLRERGLLILAKDAQGRFYFPARGFNQIDAWRGVEAYWVKLSGPAEIALEGEMIPADQSIPLRAGWNLVSYLPRVPMAVEVALAGLGDNLMVAKDGWGNFYLPAHRFSNMPLMREGKGYMVKVREEDELVYGAGGDRVASLSRGIGVVREEDLCGLYPSGVNMSLLLKGFLEGEYLIEAYAGERKVGVGWTVGGLCGMAIWGDDPTTSEIEGARAREVITLTMTRGGSREVVLVDSLILFEVDGVVVREVGNRVGIIPETFGIISIFPNPFNSQLEVVYSLPQEGEVSLIVYDLQGRPVRELKRGTCLPGTYRQIWVAGEVPSGLYFVKLKAHSQEMVKKVVLTR